MANAKTQPGRSEARNAATGAKGTASTGKSMPTPRQDAGNDAATQDQPVEPTVVLVVAPNPKRKGSIAHGFYEKYGPTLQLTDADACKTRGVRGKDLTWDAQRRHILLDDDAKNFPIQGSREEQAAYLSKLGVSDASLIKWGYMDKPEPAAEETKEEATASA